MEERLAHCLLIANVLVADGMMGDHERAFLGNVMAELGLDEEARRRVSDLDGLEDAQRVVAGFSEERRREVLDMLLAAVLVDGKVSPHERAMIEKITHAIGL